MSNAPEHLPIDLIRRDDAIHVCKTQAKNARNHGFDVEARAMDLSAELIARLPNATTEPADLHQAALDQADADKAAAVEAMREACAVIADSFHTQAIDWVKTVPGLGQYIRKTDSSRIAEAIRAIPSPAPMTVQQAARVPEVAALIYAASCVNHDNLHGNGLEGFRSNRERLSRALTAITELKP